MSALEQIAELHKVVVEECECEFTDGYPPCHVFKWCEECSQDENRLWPCATWVLATQTPAVAEAWRVLVKDRDPQDALDQAQALERD